MSTTVRRLDTARPCGGRSSGPAWSHDSGTSITGPPLVPARHRSRHDRLRAVPRHERTARGARCRSDLGTGLRALRSTAAHPRGAGRRRPGPRRGALEPRGPTVTPDRGGVTRRVVPPLGDGPRAGRHTAHRPHRADAAAIAPAPGRDVHYRDPSRRPRRPATQQRGGGPATCGRRPRRHDRRPVPVVRRHRRPGLGRQPDVRRVPHRRRDAARDADFFLCSGDNVYADGPAARSRSLLPDGRDVDQPGHPGEDQGRRDAGGVPRAVPLQPRGRQLARLPRARRPASASGTTTRSPTTGTPARSSTTPATPRAASTCSRARAHRAFHDYVPVAAISPDPDGRVYRVIHYGPMLDLFVLDMRTFKDANTADRETTADGGLLGERQTRWLLRRARSLARHLEGDRRRPPARTGGARRCDRAGGHRAGRSRRAARSRDRPRRGC